MNRRLLAFAAAAFASIAPFFAMAAQSHSNASVLVRLAKLRRGSLPRIVTAYGRVGADPGARSSVVAPLAAVVEQIDVRPGEEVGKGAPLARLAPSATTASTYIQAVSAVHVADELVQRTRTLVHQHLATGQQLANAQKSLSDARAKLTALKSEGAERPHVLHAPFHAVVTAISTSPGTLVAQGAALIELSRPEGLVLRVGVEANRAVAIHAGDPVHITPLGARDPIEGTVIQRGRLVDQNTGLVPIDIAPPSGSLIAGESAAAEIVTGEAHGYVVPHDAILVDDNGAPYVVQAVYRTARIVPVRVIDSRGKQDVVRGALDPAAPLALAGNYQLRNGMRIRTADPDQSAVGAK